MWKQIKQHLVTILVVAIILVIAIALIIVGYRFDWTGFNGNNTSGKTLWDWLQLLGVLAIPIVVGFGTAFFTRQQAKTSEANAENQQQEELLRTYFDKISELVLNGEFSTNGNVESIVRARTLAALHMLNATRKREARFNCEPLFPLLLGPMMGTLQQCGRLPSGVFPYVE